MSACALRRWGTGTPCDRPTDTPASKEMAAKLAAIRAERERQDSAYFPAAATAATSANSLTESLSVARAGQTTGAPSASKG